MNIEFIGLEKTGCRNAAGGTGVRQ